ncbi:MAG: DUF805 domain-containing protein [Muribaculaceae bacterium]|nr:DUF805 domain-containing protein [Muribaculaceae bacterium]
MKVDFVTAVKLFFDNYANFKGRASRPEYWWAALFLFLVGLVLSFICGVLGLSQTATYCVSGVWDLAVLLPSLAIVVRRLHDVGKGGGYFFVILIPLIGFFWLLALLISPSQLQPNRFGPGPCEL